MIEWAIKQKKKRRITYGGIFEPPNMYHIPLYNDVTLQYAERMAITVSSASKVTKAFMIDTYGKAYADEAYADERNISISTIRARESIDKQVVKQLSSKGYFYQEEITKYAKASRKNGGIKSVFRSYRDELLKKYDLEYRKPSAAEVEKYNLKNPKRWIFTLRSYSC